MLVDETYEFGSSENCIESEQEEEEDAEYYNEEEEVDFDEEKCIERVREINRLIAQKMHQEKEPKSLFRSVNEAYTSQDLSEDMGK